MRIIIVISKCEDSLIKKIKKLRGPLQCSNTYHTSAIWPPLKCNLVSNAYLVYFWNWFNYVLRQKTAHIIISYTFLGMLLLSQSAFYLLHNDCHHAHEHYNHCDHKHDQLHHEHEHASHITCLYKASNSESGLFFDTEEESCTLCEQFFSQNLVAETPVSFKFINRPTEHYTYIITKALYYTQLNSSTRAPPSVLS